MLMTGWLAPLFSVRILAGLPLLSSVQLLDWVVASPKSSCPMVRGVSRLTVMSAVMFSLEKSAMPDAPSGMLAVAQLDATLHEPFPRKLQVPFAAITAWAALNAAPAAATA